MNPIISNFQQDIAKVVSDLKESLKTLRTGRVNPSIVENLIVETYGGQTKLRLLELATTTMEGPSAVVINPFDPSVIKDIEKAIFKSPLGISPSTQGNRIVVRFPPLSQEQREKYIKLLGEMIEEKRSIIRNIRDETRKRIRIKHEAKEITEDDKYRLEKEIDNLTQQTMEEIKSIKENKEQQIHEV